MRGRVQARSRRMNSDVWGNRLGAGESLAAAKAPQDGASWVTLLFTREAFRHD